MAQEAMKALAFKLPEGLILRYDRIASRRAIGRSRLLREALELYLAVLDAGLCAVPDVRSAAAVEVKTLTSSAGEKHAS